jgi:hypothetical protein
VNWRVLGSLDHRLSGLDRRLHLLLAWVHVERRDRIDWRMLGSLGNGLYGLNRPARFRLALVGKGKELGDLLWCWAGHVRAELGGRGHRWMLAGLLCCWARMGNGEHRLRHLRWKDRKLLVVVDCGLWGVVTLGKVLQ